MLVEGPHGEGVHDHHVGAGRLPIAGGIGITPAVSVLRTAAQRHDQRRLLLLYGSRSWTDVTFREELTELERTLPNLKTVHVLSRPETAWDGQRGRITARLLRDVAPRDIAAWTALVCGPPQMVADVVSSRTGNALVLDPGRRIRMTDNRGEQSHILFTRLCRLSHPPGGH